MVTEFLHWKPLVADLLSVSQHSAKERLNLSELVPIFFSHYDPAPAGNDIPLLPYHAAGPSGYDTGEFWILHVLFWSCLWESTGLWLWYMKCLNAVSTDDIATGWGSAFWWWSTFSAIHISHLEGQGSVYDLDMLFASLSRGYRPYMQFYIVIPCNWTCCAADLLLLLDPALPDINTLTSANFFPVPHSFKSCCNAV